MRIKCLAKENKQCPRPGLEPRLLDPDLNADTTKLLHLHRDYNSQYVVQLKAELWPGSVNCFLGQDARVFALFAKLAYSTPYPCLYVLNINH